MIGGIQVSRYLCIHFLQWVSERIKMNGKTSQDDRHNSFIEAPIGGQPRLVPRLGNCHTQRLQRRGSRFAMSTSEKLNLREHISSPEKKPRYVNRLFETIASRYDLFTGLMSYGMDRRWKRSLAGMLELNGSELVLDIACGTGDITFEIARRLGSGRVEGLDLTQAMLDIAEQKRHDRAVRNAGFHRGDIMRMPFPDQTFDCVTAGYALRNVQDIGGALSEIMRVLKPGGIFLSLDFGHPPFRPYRWLYMKYLAVVGSAAGIMMHGDPDTYRYISETLKLYPGQRGVKAVMDSAGFVDARFREFGGGIMAINCGAKPR